MQKINLFNIDHEGLIKSLKDGVASAKSKNKERHFVWAISLLDEYFSMAADIRKSHPKKYSELIGKIYETLGDSYFGIKKYDLSFGCYLSAKHFKNSLALNKILYTAKNYGEHLNPDNAFLAFLFLLSSKNDFPGRQYNNIEFSKKISNLTSSMSVDIQLYADLYISNQLIDGSVVDNIEHEDELINSAILKYGSEKFNSALKIFHSEKPVEIISNLLEDKFASAVENFISSDALLISNRNIYNEDNYQPKEVKLDRFKCTDGFFWRKYNPEILFRTINEDINFAFKYASFINSLSGHPTVKRELEKRVGLYSGKFSNLNEKRFEILFEHPLNLDKVRNIYRKLPIS